MKPRDSDILRAVFLDELSKDEICRKFDTDRKNLRVLLHRARAAVRTTLADYLGGAGRRP